MSMSKVILITGSNTGIGFALARLLAEEKHTVYISARNEASGKAALQTLHSEGLLNVKFVLLDVTKVPTIDAACAAVDAAEGRLDVLVNNAGISAIDSDQHAPSISPDALRDTMETNFFGVVQTTTAFLPLLRKSKSPVILNVSTVLGSNTVMSRPGQPEHFAAYKASKAALNSYTIALAHELKTEGIQVNAACPGYTSTNLNHFSPYAHSVREGAEAVLQGVLIGKDGPTGKFFAPKDTEHPW